MYTKPFATAAVRRASRDPGPILLIVILNLLFVLSLVYNATHQGIPSLDSGIAAGL